jgi:hypothetical protein
MSKPSQFITATALLLSILSTKVCNHKGLSYDPFALGVLSFQPQRDTVCHNIVLTHCFRFFGHVLNINHVQSYNANALQDDTDPCRCFQQSSVKNLIGKILSTEYDIGDLQNNCVERVNDETQTLTNELYIKKYEEKQEGGYGQGFFAIGYGVRIRSNPDQYMCTEHDAIHLLDQTEAETCRGILNEGCNDLKENMCPCFTMSSLGQHYVSSEADRGTGAGAGATCDTTDEGMMVLYHSSDPAVMTPLFSLDVAAEKMCSNSQGENFDLNPNQYTHCATMFRKTCNSSGGESTLNIQPACEDTKKFKWRGKKRKWCQWASRKNTNKRCKARRIADKCPLACFGECPTD